MMLVNDVESPKPDDSSHANLVSRDGQSFVSTMALPEYDMTLHFTVPRERPGCIEVNPSRSPIPSGSRSHAVCSLSSLDSLSGA